MGIRMKKVLWICNIMLPAIARELGVLYSNREGWLSGIFEKVREGQAPFCLGVCFPAQEELGMEKPVMVEGVTCYGFQEDLNHPELYQEALEEQFRRIFADFEPDIVHIFGTEFPHTLAAVRAFHRPERTLIGIQGLCYRIAEDYMAGLPEKVQSSVTFRDFLRQDSLRQQQEKFVKRGENEKEAIKGCLNITGRTRFDREGTAKINPKARYYAMNESMREEFYSDRWTLSGCERHSLFLGQGDYPLKGMHLVLEAMGELKAEYPDIRLYVAGNNIIRKQSIKDLLKLPAYGKYLLKLIKKYHLEEQVVMLGRISAEQMKKRMLQSHVFVCASALENSPNTVGEAMLLGVPVTAARTGGIPDLLEDGKEGLLFTPLNSKELAEAVRKLFAEEKEKDGLCLSERLGKEGARRAGVTHDRQLNYLRLLEIYEAIDEQ